MRIRFGMSENLAGFRILVVEDEYFLAIEIEDALTTAGAEVIGPISDLEGAMAQVRDDGFDLAVLDINLGGDLVYPIADALKERDVPFLFASAYTSADIPERHRARRLIEKPFNLRTLLAGVTELSLSVSRVLHS